MIIRFFFVDDKIMCFVIYDVIWVDLYDIIVFYGIVKGLGVCCEFQVVCFGKFVLIVWVGGVVYMWYIMNYVLYMCVCNRVGID